MHYETNKVMMQHQVKSMQKKVKASNNRKTEIEEETTDLERLLSKTEAEIATLKAAANAGKTAAIIKNLKT